MFVPGFAPLGIRVDTQVRIGFFILPPPSTTWCLSQSERTFYVFQARD